MVARSPAFIPVMLKGMTLYHDNPFRFDFIIDSGNAKLTRDEVKQESRRMVKYFLAAMTVPQNDLWVNLSPYEADRIIPDALGKTGLGRDMLAQDYILKQLSASLLDPEEDLGKEFWAKVYQKAQEKFGVTQIPFDIFNKVWIMPEEATIYENGNAVYVIKSRLKVMLDQDYKAMQINKGGVKLVAGQYADAASNNTSTVSSQIIREIILPEIAREVNEGKSFSTIRQIYQSLILAQWYKETIKTSLLQNVYINQKKIAGVDLSDPTVKEQIYSRYVEAFKKGVVNFIKEDYDQESREVVPRKYFSGGEIFGDIPLRKASKAEDFDAAMTGDAFRLSTYIKAESTFRISEICRKIGFNIERFPKNTEIDFDELDRLYEAAVNSGKNSNGELTEEDLEFLKYYNNLFSNEYYNAHTMSGYYKYAAEGANGVNQRPDITEPKAKAIVESLGLPKGAKVLDVGCAFGYFVQDLRKLGIDAEGLDISKFAVENSDVRYRSYLHLLDSLRFRDRLGHKYYDLILLKDVLEHVPAEILPRFWKTISGLGARALITLPIANGNGEFINPVDSLDFTHVVRQDETWWAQTLGYTYERRADLNTALKQGQEFGTFCALVNMSQPLGEKFGKFNDIDHAQAFDSQLLQDLKTTETTDTEQVLQLLNKMVVEYRADGQVLVSKVDIFFATYKELLLSVFGKEEPALADYLYYKAFYKFAHIVESEFALESGVYDLFVKKFANIADLSHRKDGDVVRIALLGTAMVRAEPIKKDDYFNGKIQKKYLSPPFGVYRLERFLYENFRREIAQGRLMVDVIDPSLEYVAEGRSLNGVFDTLQKGGYDLIGFSPIRVLLGEDLLFMNRVHEVTGGLSKRPIYIAGGNEASLNSKVVLKTMPWLDYNISGLGEPVLHQMVRIAFDAKQNQRGIQANDFQGIPGLIYSREGEVKKNTFTRIDHEGFNSFADYYGENIPYQRYWKHNHSIGPVDTTFAGTRIETARIFTRNFCAVNCTFCSQSVFGRQVYTGKGSSLSVDKIARMIRRAYEVQGAKGIYFNDDDMFGSKENAKAILNRIIQLKRDGVIPQNMIFHGQTRVDMVDEEILKLIKEAGFLFLSYGVESLSDESLQGKDLRKHFTAAEAENSVRMALRAKVPITNMNLILFHPTVKREAFITTVQKTVDLLKVSIAEGARLSVNSFPLIEAYAGALINEVAAREGWPVTRDTAVTENGNFEYVVSYLPIDPEMRRVVEDDRLMKEFNEILARLVKDKRWPSVTVSRSIGINSLVMFMAAYKLLNVGSNESSVKAEDMEDLIWSLIKKFNPSIEGASNIFSEQRANVVFTKKFGKPLFRRSGMEIEGIPEEVMSKLGEKLDDDLLISFQNADPVKIKDALQLIYYTDISVEEAFEKFGIKCFKEFKKVLLVAPWGNYDGTPLKTVVPHLGLEQINHVMIRDNSNPDVDCRVFNPNLVGKEKFKEFLQKERFDLIAFSFLPVTIKNDASLIDDAVWYAPNALIVAGGLNMDTLPYKDIFEAMPFDAFLIGPGDQVLPKVVKRISIRAGAHKAENLENLKGVPNLVYLSQGQVMETESEDFVFNTYAENEVKSDVPYIKADLTHGTTYFQKAQTVHGDTVPYDMIGTRRLYVKISDRCRGNCVFCSAPRERNKPVDLDKILDVIIKNKGSYDSIHFSDNDLLVDRNLVIKLCEKIIQAGLDKIPKVAKARTDEVDPELLGILHKAGFEILTFGVESFDDQILANMQKGTTADENEKALEMTLNEGIKPGMDMIFFSPWETVDTLRRSLDTAIQHVEKGAYLSVVPYMGVQMGDQSSMREDINIEYEDIGFASTGKVFRNPKRAKLSPELESFRTDVLQRKTELVTQLRGLLKDINNGYISFSVESLLFAKAVYQLFVERRMFTPQQINYDQMIPRIDGIIVNIIESERMKQSGLALGSAPVFDKGSLVKKINDSAMLLIPGGIDMDEINIQHQGAGVDIKFDPAMERHILDKGVDGFTPVIIDLVPINSVLPLLGIEPKSEEVEYFSGV